MLTIDGNQGEGGGQILRTSLALSLVTGTPFRLVNLRAGRAKPGLRAQHLAAVRAAVAVGNGQVGGDTLGSRELTFRPGKVTPGEHHFTIGTAGSATLVLQTVLPALLTAAGPSLLTVEGGTHNPLAPPFDFLALAFLPLVNRMGPQVVARLERPGFYPAGGGRVRATVQPAPLRRLDLPERGALIATRARAVVAGGLPASIADRELAVVGARLGWDRRWLARADVVAAGPGNYVVLELESEHVTEVFTGIGARGVRAEDVAAAAVDEAAHYLAAGVPVGAHLADQLLLPLALAGGGSFRTVAPTPHLTTQIAVIRLFLGVAIACTAAGPDSWAVDVRAVD